MGNLKWWGLLVVCILTLFITKGKGTISYHKRGDNSKLIFVSLYDSNIVIEVSKKTTKWGLNYSE